MTYTFFSILALVGMQSHSICLLLSTEQNQVSSGEPVIVEIRLLNKSQGSYILSGKRDLRLYVTAPNGNEHRLLGTSLVRGGLQFYTALELEPGESGSYRIAISEWYMFEEIGHYRIAAEVPEASMGTKYKRSNVIALQVLAYDHDRLKQRAREILSGAIARSSHQWGELSALALSLILDPLAVPMLEDLLQESNLPYRSIVADGLVRQGSLDAVDVLTRNLGYFGEGEEGQLFDELLYRSLRQIAYPSVSRWLIVRRSPDPAASDRAKEIVDQADRGYMTID
ncbi:MAG: hypothetical protein OXH52_14400 [Gammaproteobacteria bacterium]|nr:hypothetical protein [Gammaproteobacteria bacterium]